MKNYKIAVIHKLDIEYFAFCKNNPHLNTVPIKTSHCLGGLFFDNYIVLNNECYKYIDLILVKMRLRM